MNRHRVLAYDRLYFSNDDDDNDNDNDNDNGAIKPVTMLVKDNFADGRMLAWTVYSGSWTVRASRLVSAYGGSGMVLLDTNFSDLVFDALVATTEGKTGHPGLLFRVTFPTSSPSAPSSYSTSSLPTQTPTPTPTPQLLYKGYKAAISPSGVITLGKADMGVFTDLAQTRMAISLGREYHVRVVAIGNEISVFVDDMQSPRIKHTDDSFKTGTTGVRVFNAAATFGNVSVARPGVPST